jgi:hypothetical protein
MLRFIIFHFILDVGHMSIGHIEYYSNTIFCQMAALELWVLLDVWWYSHNDPSLHHVAFAMYLPTEYFLGAQET